MRVLTIIAAVAALAVSAPPALASPVGSVRSFMDYTDDDCMNVVRNRGTERGAS